MSNYRQITDEQLWGGQESPGNGCHEERASLVDESINSDFCPIQNTPCMCWDGGNCQSFLVGGGCILKFADCPL